MNAPPSGPSGTPESIDQGITKFFPLTHEQLERGKGMNLTDERLHAIQMRMVESVKLLQGLKLYPKAIGYIEEIYLKLFGEPNERLNNIPPPLTDEIRKELEMAINVLIPDGLLDRGIAHIAMYFQEVDHKELEKTRLILALLHAWKSLGIFHQWFGMIPTKTDEAGLGKFYNTIRTYTISFADKTIKSIIGKSHIKGEIAYFYFPTIGADGRLKIGMVPTECVGLPRVFTSLGASEEISVEEDVEFLEEIFLHSTPLILTIQPRVKLLKIFIDKHRKFFGGKPDLSPWEAGKRQIESRKEQPKPSKKPRKKTLLGYTPPKSFTEDSGVTGISEKGVEAPPLPLPSLAPGLSYRLSVGNIWDEPVSALVPNMSEEYSLWICVETRGEVPYYFRYEHDESVDFSLPGAKTTYTFVFCEKTTLDTEPPKGKRYPQNKIDVTPRKGLNEGKDDTQNTDDGKDDEPSGNTAEDLQHQIPGRAQKILDSPHGGESGKAPEVTVEDSPTDTCSYRLMEALDALVVRRSSRGTLSMNIADWEDFELEYALSEKTYRKVRLPESVELSGLVAIVGDELENKIEVFLEQERQEFTKRTVGKLSFAYHFLRVKFAELGDISKFDSTESFSLSRGRDGSGAFIFTSQGNASYTRFFERFQTECLEEYGIYFQIVPFGTEEVIISLSLKGESRVAATITSLNPDFRTQDDARGSATKKNPEYFELSDLSHLEAEVREKMSETLIHVLIFLGTTGKVLAQSGKIITPTGYSMDRDGIIAMFQRGFRNLTDDSVNRERDERERAIDLQRKMELGLQLKVCSSVRFIDIEIPESGKKESVPIYDISTRRNGESKKLNHEGSDDLKVLYRDECLAFMRSGTGHTNIYQRIKNNIRLQKYLALRMAYAIRPNLCYDNIKDPIPPFAAKHILTRWSTLPEAVQQAFLVCFEKGNDGRVTKAIQVEIGTGVTVFSELLEVLEANDVKIIYHEPGMISLGKIRSYMKDLPKIEGK